MEAEHCTGELVAQLEVALQADLAHGQLVRSRWQFPLLVPPTSSPTGSPYQFPYKPTGKVPREGKFWFWVTQPPTQVTSKASFSVDEHIV